MSTENESGVVLENNVVSAFDVYRELELPCKEQGINQAQSTKNCHVADTVTRKHEVCTR